ncbi:nitronate monooxygenase, partial [Burkholderia sp. Tr-20355]|uniref:nitronate monooxygenase n=1 Tax=Burkholderia sp. Tr-20355 TaxID=2703895 RepID=UPI001F119AC6
MRDAHPGVKEGGLVCHQSPGAAAHAPASRAAIVSISIIHFSAPRGFDRVDVPAFTKRFRASFIEGFAMSARLFATPFSERFGLRLPLVQAPMVGATTTAMVAAASNAGALGSLGAAAFAPERLATEVDAIRAATDRPFAVNLFVLPDATPVARSMRPSRTPRRCRSTASPSPSSMPV